MIITLDTYNVMQEKDKVFLNGWILETFYKKVIHFKNDMRHHLQYPAVIYCDGTKYWYRNDFGYGTRHWSETEE